MKTGQEVAVCYDGKYGRRVKGIVTKQHNGHHISVKFIPWAAENDTEVEVKFRRGRNNKHWEGYHLEVDASIHRALCACPGDYYTIKGRWIENWTGTSNLRMSKWYSKMMNKPSKIFKYDI